MMSFSGDSKHIMMSTVLSKRVLVTVLQEHTLEEAL